MSFRYCATKRPTAQGSAAVIHLEFYGNPFLMVANPRLRFFHAEERERGVVRPVVGLAKPAQMREAGVAVFGPDAQGAQLEGSKTYSKEFMQANGIPTLAMAASPSWSRR